MITDNFFPGLGWSLYSSHTWRPLEVEICSHELSWLSLRGCTNKLISYSYWFRYLSPFSLCWLQALVYEATFVYRWMMIVSFFLCMNEGRRDWWKGVGLHSKVNAFHTHLSFSLTHLAKLSISETDVDCS